MKLKKRSVTEFLLFFVLLCVLPANAMALGLGIYGNGGAGRSDIDGSYTVGGSSYDRSFDQDSRYLGYGLVLDTAVAKNEWFNYRLNLGRERITFIDDSGPDLKLNGFVLDQDFGFAFVKTKKIRLWAGPEVRLAYFRDSQYETAGYRMFNTEYNLWGAGIGPVFGTNFNFGRFFSLAVKLGYLYTYLSGSEKVSDYTTLNYPKIHYKMQDGHEFFNIAVIFRLDDFYGKKPEVEGGEVLK